MTSGNQTPASRLHDCKDKLEQAELDAERNRGLAAELTRLQTRLADTELRLQQDTNQGALRLARDELTLVTTRLNSAEKRVVAAERYNRELEGIITEVRALVKGKECILPQIARLLGVS